MVFYCFGKLRLERCELVVQDQGICAILSDPGGADLPATNNLQGVGFHALDNGLCNRALWLATETQIGTCSIRRHQIERACCRARLCRYVYIAIVAGYIKKKIDL